MPDEVDARAIDAAQNTDGLKEYPYGGRKRKTLWMAIAIVGIPALLMLALIIALVVRHYFQVQLYNDLPTVRAAAKAFLDDLAASRISAAFQRTHSVFQQAIDLAAFEEFVKRYPVLAHPKEQLISSIGILESRSGPEAHVKGKIKDDASSVTFGLVMNVEEREWRVRVFVVQ